MSDDLFDRELQLLRRHRARRQGLRTFLHERAADDILDRLLFVRRSFVDALVIGCPEGQLRGKLSKVAAAVTHVEALEDAAPAWLGRFDLCLVIGTLDTANDVPLMLRLIHALMSGDALFAGAFAGNDSFPVLRAAMLAADQAAGRGAAPRVHPRIDAASVAPLLQDAGFVMPVVDIDRVSLRYRRFSDLISDLRGMAATNILTRRSRVPLTRGAIGAADECFRQAGDGSVTTERVEIVHFAAWTRS